MFNPLPAKGAFLGQVRIANEGSPGRRWWMHHIRNTRALAEAAFAGNDKAALAAIGELWSAVKSWELLTKSAVAGVLIGEHTVLAKLLVDCLASGANSACSLTAVDALMRNVEAQRALFPKNAAAFGDLFKTHTELAGAYITDLANKDQEAFQAHWAKALENGDALGAFTDETFFGKK